VEKPSRVQEKNEDRITKRKTLTGNLKRLPTLTFYIQVTAKCLIFRTYWKVDPEQLVTLHRNTYFKAEIHYNR
jgi:hypothetical protein